MTLDAELEAIFDKTSDDLRINYLKIKGDDALFLKDNIPRMVDYLVKSNESPSIFNEYRFYAECCIDIISIFFHADSKILDRSNIRKLVKIKQTPNIVDSIHNFKPYRELMDYIADEHPRLFPKKNEI